MHRCVPYHLPCSWLCLQMPHTSSCNVYAQLQTDLLCSHVHPSFLSCLFLMSTCVSQMCLLVPVASPPAEEHTCDCNNLALLLQQLHQVELVSWRAPSKHLHEQQCLTNLFWDFRCKPCHHAEVDKEQKQEEEEEWGRTVSSKEKGVWDFQEEAKTAKSQCSWWAQGTRTSPTWVFTCIVEEGMTNTVRNTGLRNHHGFRSI